MKMVKRQQQRFPEYKEFNSDTLKVAESTVLKRHEIFRWKGLSTDTD
jgi:hypothetical protein